MRHQVWNQKKRTIAYTVGASVTWDSENMGLQPHKGHSGCSNAHDIQVWSKSNTHHILAIGAKETHK